MGRESRFDGLSVLAVEDNSDEREMLVYLLEREGARVTAAESVAEALDAYERVRPDVVICDLHLGKDTPDGFAFVEALRRRSPRAPVVALTGYTGLHLRGEVRSAGFDAYCEKPFRPEDLVETVAELSRRS